MTAKLSSKLLRTDKGRAAAALAWHEGYRQKDIAKAFGLTSPCGVNQEIRWFLYSYYYYYLPSGIDDANGYIGSYIGRDAVPLAVARWRELGDA